MRLRQSRMQALLLLLPTFQVLITSIAAESSDKTLARAKLAALADDSSLPKTSFVPAASPKGTKDAPVDGMDGKPHAGPYVDDSPKAHEKKPNIVEELRPGKVNSPKPSTTLVGEDDAVLDGDKSVMQDPDRKKATGSTGTEGGISTKDKERLAHETKTGEKMEKIPESPKEARPNPHDDQKQLGTGQKDETSSRVLGAVGLEVGDYAVLSRSIVTDQSIETDRFTKHST